MGVGVKLRVCLQKGEGEVCAEQSETGVWEEERSAALGEEDEELLMREIKASFTHTLFPICLPPLFPKRPVKTETLLCFCHISPINLASGLQASSTMGTLQGSPSRAHQPPLLPCKEMKRSQASLSPGEAETHEG
ncbi:unnamed protein product [Lepidochelys kempii]